MAQEQQVLVPIVRKLMRRSPLAPADVQALLALPYTITRANPGDYLVSEGQKPDRCFALLSSFIFRGKVAGNGARQILGVHLRGDLIDLQNSLLDVADHNVRALTRVELASIPNRAIIDLADAHPAIARAFWRDTLVDASLLREWMLNVGQRDAQQRIAHLFCELALRQEVAGICQGPRYAWPMTQEQIGNATGLTTVHVNRMLQALRKAGLIASEDKTVTILDWEGLCAVGDFLPDYLHLPNLTPSVAAA